MSICICAKLRSSQTYLISLYIAAPYVHFISVVNPSPEVTKLFSCSTQLSRKFLMLIGITVKKFGFLGSDKPRMLFFPLIHVKMPTVVGILTFMSRKKFMLS